MRNRPRPDPKARRNGSPRYGRLLRDRRLCQQQRRAGALTLNCPEVKEAAGAFLTALATRYRAHPAIGGYDVWNECNSGRRRLLPGPARPSATGWSEVRHAERWRKAWHRYSYAEWDDIEPPTHDGALPRMHRLAAVPRDNAYDADAVAHRHDPRRRPEEPDHRARHLRHHPEHGRERKRRLAGRRPRSRPTASPGSRRARATSPGRAGTASTSSALRRAASRSGTPRPGRAALAAAAGDRPRRAKKAASPRRRTSGSGA